MARSKSWRVTPAGDPAAPPPLKFPERRFSPIRNIGVRILIAVGALVITTILVYTERDCYRDLDEMGTLTWIDSLYYATVTLSTTGYGDITPVCDSARLVNVVLITPLRFIFLIVLVGTTIEVLTQRTREQLRSNRWRNNVNDHTVIIGYGVKGRAAASSLVDAGTPRSQIVVVAVIERDFVGTDREEIVGGGLRQLCEDRQHAEMIAEPHAVCGRSIHPKRAQFAR